METCLNRIPAEILCDVIKYALIPDGRHSFYFTFIYTANSFAAFPQQI